MDEIHFSLDGCSQESVIKYQVGSNFDIAYDNLCRLVELRNCTKESSTVIIWKYVVFNWNDSAFDLAKTRKLADNAGVDVLRFTFTTNPFYGISWRFLFSSHWRSFAPIRNNIRQIEIAGKLEHAIDIHKSDYVVLEPSEIPI